MLRFDAGGLAAAVPHSGNDPRWRGFPRAQTPAPGRPSKWRSPPTRLATGGALMLRLRTAFGVEVRSDALVHLHATKVPSDRGVAAGPELADVRRSRRR